MVVSTCSSRLLVPAKFSGILGIIRDMERTGCIESGEGTSLALDSVRMEGRMGFLPGSSGMAGRFVYELLW